MRTDRDWRAKATPAEAEILNGIDARLVQLAEERADLCRLRYRIANRLCQRARYDDAKNNSAE